MFRVKTRTNSTLALHLYRTFELVANRFVCYRRLLLHFDLFIYLFSYWITQITHSNFILTKKESCLCQFIITFQNPQST